MSASPCPTCGWGLRWLPEQGAWGCDRCRKLVAPPPPSAAPPPYAHPPYGPGGPGMPMGAPPPGAFGAVPPPGPRSRRGLALGLGLGGAAIAGVIVAVVVATGGGAGGAGSRDELVREALAAVRGGDVDGLLALGDPVAMRAQLLDCAARDRPAAGGSGGSGGGGGSGGERDEQDDRDDPALEAKRLRRQYERLVAEARGRELELLSVEEKAGAGVPAMKQGDRARDGCVFKRDVALHTLVAKVRTGGGEGGPPREALAELTVLEAGDRWYLTGPPKLGGDASRLEGAVAKFRDRACACQDAACADGVHDEMAAWAKQERAAAQALAAADRERIDAIDEEMKACRRKLREAADPVRAALAKMEELRAEMCRCADRACADAVNARMQEWMRSVAGDRTQPGADDERKLENLARQYGTCMAKASLASEGAAAGGSAEAGGAAGGDASGTPPEGPAEDPPSARGDVLAALPACAAYRREIERIAACPKYPAAAVTALRDSFAQLEKSWAAIRGNDAAREQMGKTCAMMADSVKQGLAAICP